MNFQDKYNAQKKKKYSTLIKSQLKILKNLSHPHLFIQILIRNLQT